MIVMQGDCQTARTPGDYFPAYSAMYASHFILGVLVHLVWPFWSNFLAYNAPVRYAR